jgi:hypothetical protein
LAVDNLAIGVRLPSGTFMAPIPAKAERRAHDVLSEATLLDGDGQVRSVHTAMFACTGSRTVTNRCGVFVYGLVAACQRAHSAFGYPAPAGDHICL